MRPATGCVIVFDYKKFANKHDFTTKYYLYHKKKMDLTQIYCVIYLCKNLNIFAHVFLLEYINFDKFL